jgi:CHAT domain-containing protein
MLEKNLFFVMVLKKNLISNNSKIFLLSLFFFFNTSLYSKSLDDFLSWDFLTSQENLDCPSLEKSFSEVTRKNKDINFNKNYQLTKDILEKNCSLDLEVKITLDKSIQSKFNLFSVSKSERGEMNFDEYFRMTSELDLKVYIFYIKDILNPHLEKNDIKKISFLYEKVSQDLIDLHQFKVLHDITFTSIYFNLVTDFLLQGRWELYSNALKDLEIYMVDFIDSEIKNSGRDNVKFENFNSLASDLMLIRFDRILALSSNQNNEELLTSIKQIIDLYLYDPNTDFKVVNFQEFYSPFYGGPEITTTQIKIPFQKLETLASAFLGFVNNGDDVPFREYKKFKAIVLNYINNNPEIRLGYVFTLNAIGIIDVFIGEYSNTDFENTDNCNSFKKIKFNESYLENIDYIEFRSLGGLEISCDVDKNIAFNKTLNKKFNKQKTGNLHLFLSSLNNINLFKINKKLYELEPQSVENFALGIKFAELHFNKVSKILEMLDDNTPIISYEDLAIAAAAYGALDPWGPGRYLSLDQKKSIENLIERKLIIYEEIFLKNLNSTESYSSLKFMATHMSLLVDAYLKNTLSYSLFEENYLNLENLDSFHNLHTRYALIALKPLDKNQIQNLKTLVSGIVPIYALIDKMEELNPKETNELSWVFKNKPPEIFNIFSKFNDFRNLRLWTHYLGTLGYLPEIFGEGTKEKPLRIVELENNALLNLFSLENISPVTYAFQVQALKKKYQDKDENFYNLIKDYYGAILDYSEFKESLINFNSIYPGVSSMQTDYSNNRLYADIKFANEAESRLVNFKDSNDNFVFKNSDFFINALKVKEVQEILKENEVLLLPIRSYLAPGFNQFIAKSKSWFKVGYGGYYTDNLIKDINSSLEFNSENKPKEFDLESSAMLYEELLRDLDNLMLPKENKKLKIYVVVSESFKELPFSLLYDKKRNKYAFENFEFIYLDNAHSLRFLESKPPTKIKESLKYLAFADPKLDGNSKNTDFKNLFAKKRSDNGLIRELARLPETSSEVKSIAKNFKNAKVFIQEEATEQRLKSEELKISIQEADIISFATHTFSDASNYTTEHGLVLSPPPKKLENYENYENDVNDGFLSSKEITKLEFNGSLVVLSACDTNQPIYLNAPPFSGLTKSFIQAGARSVLFTNWNIDSLSAKIFMTNTFQTGLDKNTTISEAISLTMQKFADGHFGDEYKHPFYWAPYQLLGDF